MLFVSNKGFSGMTTTELIRTGGKYVIVFYKQMLFCDCIFYLEKPSIISRKLTNTTNLSTYIYCMFVCYIIIFYSVIKSLDLGPRTKLCRIIVLVFVKV